MSGSECGATDLLGGAIPALGGWPFSDCDALFNTYCFVLVFLPVALLGYWAIPRRGWKLAWLAAFSFLFYSLWDVRFVGLLVASSVVDFAAGIRIAQAESQRARKTWLWASIVFNLGVLAVFKYMGFARDNVQGLMEVVGIGATLPAANIVLPVGISFYTFQTLSYTIDVYRGKVGHTRDFLKYLCYVTMFPQLVAGPIVRYSSMDKQLDELPRRLPRGFASTGVTLFAIGLTKKLAIADSIAIAIDPIWAGDLALNSARAWLAALGYTAQLYFDFSGYSDMAIGIGAMLGFRYPINFNAPYQARNPSDFWRRWHISLSTFLRDYLYIPLGGNQHGPRRTNVNLLVVMLLGGLWHGAAWTFVIWGGYHGVLLVAHRLSRRSWDAAPVVVQRAGMFFLAVIGWVTFRATSMSQAGAMYAHMFSFDDASWGELWLPLAGVAAVLGFSFVAKPAVLIRWKGSGWQWALSGILLAACIVLLGSRESPFLYYQF